MANIKIVNTLSATEAVIENAGNKTGPYAGICKRNAIEVPMPRTAMKIRVEAGEELNLDVADYRDVAFFKDMKVPGLEVTVDEGAAEAASVEDAGVPAYSGEDETQTPVDPVNPEDEQGE